MTDKSLTVRSVPRSLIAEQVLAAMAAGDDWLTTAEVAQRVERSHNQTLQGLHALEAEGLLAMAEVAGAQRGRAYAWRRVR